MNIKEAKVKKYCARMIVQLLNGDKELFYSYMNEAMKIYNDQKSVFPIGDMVPEYTKEELYKIVS